MMTRYAAREAKGKLGLDRHPAQRKRVMAKMERKTFDAPEETRTVNRDKTDVVKLGDVTAMHVRFELGWRWSECVRAVVGTDNCKVAHLMHVIAGLMGVRTDHGTEVEFRPGDVEIIPPGHDAWIIGQEPFVANDFQGGAVYAEP
jgi:hypothetical protein